MEEIVEKIRSKGYWRVVIRPQNYNNECLSDLSECRDILRSSVVSLRGWDYPYYDFNKIKNTQEYITSLCDFDEVGISEYWRFYKSGQFLHLLSMSEDWARHYSFIANKGIKGLDFIPALYRVTAVYEFASRLVSKMLSPNDSVNVLIELYDTEKRELITSDISRNIYRHVCIIPNIKKPKTITVDEIISKSSEISIQVVTEIFETFNWVHVPVGLLMEEQKKYLEKRS
jgi:hypothetical protein